MATVPPTSTLSAPTNSTTTTKKARLIPKDLDRSNTRQSARSNRKQKTLKAGVNRPRPTKFRGKARGNFQKRFKRGGPSNYEANSKVTHTFVTAVPAEALTLQLSTKRLSSARYNRLPASTGELEIDHVTTAAQRTLTHYYQPSTTVNICFSRELRSRRLRLESDYRQLRCALMAAPRLRASYRATRQTARTWY